MDDVEHLIIGAGPAGLRAAQVLAEAGREVLVLEKRPEVGPKTCAGGLTAKSMRELRPLGLPPGSTLASEGHVAFAGGRAVVLDAELTLVHTIPRRELGQYQLQWAREAGATVVAGSAVTTIDLVERTVVAGGRQIRWRHLLGADGSDSAVRRALGLASPREYFAAEYNVPRLRLEPLRIEADPSRIGSGYFWIFPHHAYTSIGAVAPKHGVPPATLRRYLDERCDQLGVSRSGVPFEGATLEVLHRGFHFPGGVHLAGDAAGVPSSLTAEGIYAAIVTGEEVARTMLEPTAPKPKTRSWLRTKRWHDRLARWLARPTARDRTLQLFAGMGETPWLRRPLASWLLRG